MNEDTIYISSDGIDVIDTTEHSEEVAEHFLQIPKVAKPLLFKAKVALNKIETMF